MGKILVVFDNSGLVSCDKLDKFWDVNGIRLVKIKEIFCGLVYCICFVSVVIYFVVVVVFFKVVIGWKYLGKV